MSAILDDEKNLPTTLLPGIEAVNEPTLVSGIAENAVLKPTLESGATTTAMSANAIFEAYQASRQEHRMTFRSALVAYRWALVWTVVMSSVSPRYL